MSTTKKAAKAKTISPDEWCFIGTFKSLKGYNTPEISIINEDGLKADDVSPDADFNPVCVQLTKSQKASNDLKELAKKVHERYGPDERILIFRPVAELKVNFSVESVSL